MIEALLIYLFYLVLSAIAMLIFGYAQVRHHSDDLDPSSGLVQLFANLEGLVARLRPLNTLDTHDRHTEAVWPQDFSASEVEVAVEELSRAVVGRTAVAFFP